MKTVRYLVLCGALTVGMGSSAYATKGGGLLQKLKPTAWLNKVTPRGGLARAMAIGGLGFTLICGGITGCGEDGSLTVTLAVTDLYTDEYVYFTLDGIIYQGYVVRGYSSSEILIKLSDSSSEMVVHTDWVNGVLITNHADLYANVMLEGDPQYGEDWLEGEITAVYSDGYREITVYAIYYDDGSYTELGDPFTMFVHRNTHYSQGGYVFLPD